MLVVTSQADLDESSMEAIRDRHGLPGILLVPPAAAGSVAEKAFALKSLLADVRAHSAHQGVVALQIPPGADGARLMAKDLAAYADVVVGALGDAGSSGSQVLASAPWSRCERRPRGDP